MNIVRYGKWEISADTEKTKEYYRNYAVNSNQANRNFAKFCEQLTDEEKSFFEAFGIDPLCCEIEHIGVNRRKEFPCGGYYLIYGRYLKWPEEETMTVEELAEKGFVDDREDPRINIGRFEFEFQCEYRGFCEIPGNMPDGFICVTFWCEDMRWLLDEKPDDDMIMYEAPRFWEIGKILKEKREARKQRAAYREEQKQEFKNTFEKLNIEYSELSAAEINAYKRKWLDAFSPADADKKEIKRLCLSDKRFSVFLWHLFSYKISASEENAEEAYNNTKKTECIIISNLDEIGFSLINAERLTADTLNDFVDVTVSDKALSWTYCKTHESMCGPYFCKIPICQAINGELNLRIN